MPGTVEIYLSYAPQDELLVRELEKHLVLLKRAGLLAGWYDPYSHVGSDWLDEYEWHLNTAGIILLFVSADYLASNRCYGIEMKRALERYEKGETRTIPIILRPVDWKETLLNGLPALPVGEKPVSQWSSLDEAFFSVAREIRKIVQDANQTLASIVMPREKTPEEVVSSLPIAAREAITRGDMIAFKQYLEEYYAQHSNERLVIFGDEILYFEHFVSVTYAWQYWKLLTSMFVACSPLALGLAEELMQLLSSVLLPTSTMKFSLRESGAFLWQFLDMQRLFGNTRIPSRLPVLFYKDLLFDENCVKEILNLLYEINQKHCIALMLLLVEQEYAEDAQRMLKDVIHAVYACDIIPITCVDFLKIIDAQNPKRTFRRYVISKVDLEVISPFEINGATPDSMFFGREHELRVIRERISLSSYALIGGRRIGKTSILRRLQRFGLPAAGFRAFSHDCSYTPTEQEVVQAVLKPWFPDLPTHQISSFSGVIQALPQDKPIVVLLDEVDKLIAPDKQAGYPFLRTLRALANAGYCTFVFSGEHALRRNMMDPQSPMYNFPTELLIGCLNLKAVRELVVQPMKEMEIDLVDEEQMVQHIWDFTSGHPNIVQRLCKRLVDRLNQKQRFLLDTRDVEEVVSSRDFFLEDFLNIYWEKATTLERLCSLIMALDEDLRSLSVVHKALHSRDLKPSLNEVYDALERLVDLRNILYRTNGGYDFAAGAFPKVVSRRSDLLDLIARNCENYRDGDV